MDWGLIDACPNALNGASQNLFMTLITALFASHCKLAPDNRYPPDYAPKLQNGEEFDFIIVGAGSAGSLLANRLSAEARWKVLLIEAGNYPSILTEVPTLFSHIQGTDEDWQYQTEPSETWCSGLKNNVCAYPRGKVLGGSSSINAMFYLRSHREDHDNWVRKGNIGWDYQSALRYYKKFENYRGEESYYGKGGELNISNLHVDSPLRNLLIETYQEMGFKKVINSASLGYGDSSTTISEGTRMNSAKAFLSNIKDRSNLFVALNAEVGKVLFDENQANGVKVRVNQRFLTIKAKKEVILSAGAINSPQILMNSGVGPKQHLESLGIPVKQDLSVGENFQDHPIYLGLFANIKESVYPQKSDQNLIDDIYQYVMHRKGYFAISPLINFHLYVNIKNKTQNADIQVNHVPFGQNSADIIETISKAFNLPPEINKIMVENNKKSSNIILFPKLLKPKSRGILQLRSTNPFDKPLIRPNYLSEEEDIDLMLESIRLVQRTLATKTFAKANPELVDLQLRKCKMYEYNTDDYWRCALRNYVTHLHHPTGTCKMGPNSDPEAVVSPDLKVHGIKGLRVIDASIMPQISSVNTNAPTYMIAEKGSELLKDEWLKKHEEL